MTRRRLLRVAVLLAGLVRAAASGQLVTDEVPRSATVPAREELRRDLDESRFRLGALRIAPRLEIENLGYNDNVNGSTDDPVADYTGTLTLGARLTLPLSTKVALRADAFPSYIWYAHSVERRAAGGRAAGSLLAFLNHVTFLATVDWSLRDTVVGSEVLALQREDVRGARVDLEVTPVRRFSIVANGELQERRYSSGGDPNPVTDYSINDRKESAARAGVRYSFSEASDVSLGVEGTWTVFDKVPEQRDNESRAVILGARLERKGLVVHFSGGYRHGAARNGSTFPAYDEPTGSGYVSVTVVRPLDLELTGHRRITYSLGAEPPYYLETRWGGGIVLRPASRVTLHGTADWGTNRYTVGERPDPAGRVDDAFEYGGSLEIVVAKNVTLRLSLTRSRYDSNVDGFDRSYSQLGVGVRIGKDFL